MPAAALHSRSVAPNAFGRVFLWLWAAFFFGMLYAVFMLNGLGFIAHARIANHLDDYRPARFEVAELYRPTHRSGRGQFMLHGRVLIGERIHALERVSGTSALVVAGAATVEELAQRVKPGQVLDVLFDPQASDTLYQGESMRVVHTDAARHRARWSADLPRLVPLVAWLLYCLWRAVRPGLRWR